MPLSLLIAGGGTGGHLYPGVTVARELIARIPDARVVFVGTAAGFETRVIRREGFTLEVIRTAGLKGKSLGSLVRSLALLPLSAIDAWQVISRHCPSVVVGLGGYSSGPVVLVAALRGVPTLVMEQNAMPGFTNRLLAPVVNAAAVTFQECVRFFGDKAFVSGNPVRREFFESGGTASGCQNAEMQEHGVLPPGVVRILVFGGSQGASAINLAMVEAAARLAVATPRLAITHQTGERDLEFVRDGYRRARLEARVEPFLFAMDREMNAADLVVCRAGATTVAELTACGRASILVPLPTASDDHQRWNAQALGGQGAALIVEQRDLSGDRLATEILVLASDADRRRMMAAAAGRLGRPEAAKTIVDRLLTLAR